MYLLTLIADSESVTSIFWVFTALIFQFWPTGQDVLVRLMRIVCWLIRLTTCSKASYWIRFHGWKKLQLLSFANQACSTCETYGLQGRRKVGKSGGTHSTVVGIIWPPGWDRVNCLAENWGGYSPPTVPPLVTALRFDMSCFLNGIVWKFSYLGPILQYKIHICLLWPSQEGILDNLTYSIINGKFSYWGPK